MAESDRIAAQNERLADLANEIIRRPNDVNLRCEAGQIMLDQGYYDAAKIWLLSALHCDAEHAPTREALARYDEITAGNDRLPAVGLRPTALRSQP